MKVLWSTLAAAVAAALIWVLGGPFGAALAAPGLLLLRGAAALGAAPGGREGSLRQWLQLGTALAVAFWWTATYVALALAGRRGAERRRSGRDAAAL